MSQSNRQLSPDFGLRPRLDVLDSLRQLASEEPSAQAITETLVSLYPLATGLGTLIVVNPSEYVGRAAVFPTATVLTQSLSTHPWLKSDVVTHFLDLLAATGRLLRKGHLLLPIADPSETAVLARYHQVQLLMTENPLCDSIILGHGEYAEPCYVAAGWADTALEANPLPLSLLEEARGVLEWLLRAGSADGFPLCL